ncbi:MAG: hypoxanthine phosphoribosyltransferase [Haliscomenobacter sp.]|uniref:hypoxanthine phosphoribosyltransferase n=1 Tax=Haliscomenobacter sp. TaxID=2717303 RepID=UPI0029B67299|nr:hypoxanthine phosphoribosyltransferase [Haliscomenobacter sp.]MDX2067306.1 hypoxanthine phosphoribosyltransferase [Haliscomenobacter sp.]
MITVNNLQFKPFIAAETIQQRIEELGAALRERYAGQRPLFIGILNGAFIVTADLVRAAGLECEVTFMRLSSYAGLQSTGQVTTNMGLDIEIKDRHVILVEDIIDSGRTLYELTKNMREQGPASVAIATLLLKPDALQFPLEADFVGFSIPSKFVIGYGLDYNQAGRELKEIYQLAE